MQKKKIAILGSSGSIGTQALEVIQEHPDEFEVEVLTANGNADLLIAQSKKFKPNTVVIADEAKYLYVKDALANDDIHVYAGEAALSQVMEMESIDMVLTAVVGFAGLKPTLAAINAGKQIALANKETLVVAGELVTKLAKEKNVKSWPEDMIEPVAQAFVGESLFKLWIKLGALRRKPATLHARELLAHGCLNRATAIGEDALRD